MWPNFLVLWSSDCRFLVGDTEKALHDLHTSCCSDVSSHTPLRPAKPCQNQSLAIRSCVWMETSSTLVPNHLCSLASFQEIPGRRCNAQIPQLGNQQPDSTTIHPRQAFPFQSLCPNSSLWPWTWPSRTLNGNQEHHEGL